MVAHDSCMQGEPCLGTPLHACTRINACTNHYTNLCSQPHTLEGVLVDTEKKQNVYKIRHADEHKHAVLASVIGRHFQADTCVTVLEMKTKKKLIVWKQTKHDKTQT